MVLQEAKAKAALTAIGKGSERELATFRKLLADAPPGSALQTDMQKLVDLEEQELSTVHKALLRDLPDAGQLAKQAVVASGKGAVHLLGRGIGGLGRRLSALEEEPMPGKPMIPRLARAPLGGYGMKEASPVRRLPIVSSKVVEEGLTMPGEVTRRIGGLRAEVVRKHSSWFFDERLRELRATDDPHIAIRLAAEEVPWFRERAH